MDALGAFREVLLLAVVIVSVSANCRYKGKSYKTNDRFPDGCDKCICRASGDVECYAVDCMEPACPESLQVQLQGECCPVCTCKDDQYGHGTMKIGEEFSADGGCTHCTCLDTGHVTCSMASCMAVLPCNDSMQVKEKDQCCSTCKPGYCYHDQKGIPILKYGDTWQSEDGCTMVNCVDDGSLAFAIIDCAPLNCPTKYIVKKKGECCPTCKPGCYVDYLDRYVLVEKQYTCHHYTDEEKRLYSNEKARCESTDGHVFTRGNNAKYPGCGTCWCCAETGGKFKGEDGCSTCECVDDGSIQCRSDCDESPCHPALTVHKKGACCPTCLDGCYVDGLGHVDVGDFKPVGGCGTCKCKKDGSITCLGQPCNALTCEAHATEMAAGDCCPKCVGCIIEGVFVRAGEEYTGRDPCRTCRCIQEGGNTTAQCFSMACSPCGPGEEYKGRDPCRICRCIQDGGNTTAQCISMACSPCGPGYEAVAVTGKCCPRCDRIKPTPGIPKPNCDLVKCRKPACPKKIQFQDETKCCPQCKCKHKGQFFPPGPVGDDCDGCVCNGDTRKVTCTKPDCPKNVMCVNPVRNKRTCCYECPNNIITCWHPKTKKIITKGKYDFSSKKEICTCAGDPWYPYAFCAKRKIKTKSFKKFANCLAPYMQG